MSGRHSRFWYIGVIALWSLALLLALRFDARTYPGWYFPNSTFLNSLLNGNSLFTDVGYPLVLVAAIVAVTRLWISVNADRRLCRVLALVQWIALAGVMLIFFYGLWWAFGMERLPWQAEGHASDWAIWY